MPTAATGPLSQLAATLARHVFRPGYAYRRIGLLAHHLTATPGPVPADEDLAAAHDRHHALSQALDAITRRYGTASIGLGPAGLRQQPSWAPRQSYLWPVSTVNWHWLPVLHC